MVQALTDYVFIEALGEKDPTANAFAMLNTLKERTDESLSLTKIGNA